MHRFLPFIAIVALVASRQTSADEVRFARDILPVLSENCYHCHGPDEEQRQADLRLDTAEGVAATVDPDTHADSEILRRVLSTDPDEMMPPPDSNRSLTTSQKMALKIWIERGAEWGNHWAFETLISSAVPAPSFSEFPLRNPIDHFVQQRLHQERLIPSTEAPRATLLRRIHLDLTGLPPSVADVNSFLTDSSAAAYENVVDRLLASSAFGERMAWDWLDAARYADTNGYQGDRERTMWPWRDWVVNAFNSDMPFDQFTVQQLAGDLLPNATVEQKLATGFCRNYMINGEGGRIAEENRVDYVMDMSETMGTIWLGLTLNCCRCHDHKYDPLTQEDYYQFFAFFNQTPVNGGGGDPQTAPNLNVPTTDQKARLRDLDLQLTELRKQKNERKKQLIAGRAVWEAKTLAGSSHASWSVRKPIHAEARHQKLRILKDSSVLAEGTAAENDTYTVRYSLTKGTIGSLQLDALQHKSLTGNGLSRSGSGNFVLTEIECSIIRSGNRMPVKFISADATFEQGPLTIAKTFDGQPNTGWAVWNGGNVDREHSAALRFSEPVEVNRRDVLEVILRQDSEHKFHTVGRFRLATSESSSAALSIQGTSLFANLRVPQADRTQSQDQSIIQTYLLSDSEFRRFSSQETKLSDSRTKVVNSAAKVMVMADRGEWRPTFVLNRGLYNDITTREVTATTPGSFPKFPGVDSRMNRLDLANWLLSKQQPLTARVTVNRFWQQFFGIGLVKTVEDFGVQSEYPEYKDLLDWLAFDFRSNGWNIKRLVRQIVTSHTYRQSSVVRNSVRQAADGTELSLAEIDPDNRLLARSSRFRMPSWMLRDHALAASGLLNRKTGGPPVNTYQPAGIWEEATFGKKKYIQDTGEKLYRRSLYIFWRRIIAPTMFFDNASRQSCTVKSFRTNTPLHSLLTLNEVTYVESARCLAQNLLTDSGLKDDTGRSETAFLSILNRPPTELERSILLAGVARSRAEYRESPSMALDLLSVGESARDETIDSTTHAAWTSACLALFNTDEALSRE